MVVQTMRSWPQNSLPLMGIGNPNYAATAATEDNNSLPLMGIGNAEPAEGLAKLIDISLPLMGIGNLSVRSCRTV